MSMGGPSHAVFNERIRFFREGMGQREAVDVQRESCQRDAASWNSACNQWSSARPTGLPSCSQMK